MSAYNIDNNNINQLDKKCKTATKPNPSQVVTSQTGEYRLYPTDGSDDDEAIHIERVDGKQIPTDHQSFLEQFVSRPDTWIATLVPSDHSRYVIGLQSVAVRGGSYTEIVHEIVEEL